jgi:hypothetical protein
MKKEIVRQKKIIFNNRRDDLYYKTLIRDVRKFFLTDFNMNTQFTNQAHPTGRKETFRDSIIRYITERISVSIGNCSGNTEDLITCLGSLISHKQF